jgi:hypothetical protein
VHAYGEPPGRSVERQACHAQHVKALDPYAPWLLMSASSSETSGCCLTHVTCTTDSRLASAICLTPGGATLAGCAGEAAAARPPWDRLLQYAWPRALVLLVAILWSSNYSVMSLVGRQMTAADAALARFGVAACALVPFLFVGPRGELVDAADGAPSREPAVPTGLAFYGVLCGVCSSVGYFTQTIALETAAAGTVAFIGRYVSEERWAISGRSRADITDS